MMKKTFGVAKFKKSLIRISDSKLLNPPEGAPTDWKVTTKRSQFERLKLFKLSSNKIVKHLNAVGWARLT